jgi:copper chaperone CopZ
VANNKNTEETMTEKTFKIDGMTCHHCVKAVEVELEEIGVENKEVEIGSAKVKYDENKLSEQDVEKAIEEAGYEVVK